MEKWNEVMSYIERSVPDIARKCNCSQDDVIAVMRYFVNETHKLPAV